jgi:alpha-L-fucosidase 2
MITALVLSLAMLGAKPAMPDNSPLRLWYDKPTTDYMSGLPIGKGHIGAMVLGEPGHQRVALNHQQLWRRKYQDRKNKVVAGGLAEFRRLMFEGKIVEANRRAGELLGWEYDGVDSYQPVGDLWIDFPEVKSYTDYRRELDLSTGVVTTSFQSNGMGYKIEAFISRPDNVIVVHLSTSKPKGLHSDISLSRIKDPECEMHYQFAFNRVRMKGQFKEGVGFAVETGIFDVHTPSVLSDWDDSPTKWGIAGVSSATLVTAISTSPDVRTKAGAALSEETEKKVNPAYVESLYPVLLKKHIPAHTKLFERVKLRIGSDTRASIPTDQRLAALKAGKPDPSLEALYFAYGRYLLMSSSAPGDLPANLQGIWNEDLNPAWWADYHTNINIQMNYWPAEVANLSECHDPLFDFVEKLAKDGRQSAKELYGAKGVWIGQSTDKWGLNRKQRGPWTEWVGAAPWLAQHFWWRYEYTGDKTFLKNRAYPFMKEAAAFFEDYLVEDPRPDSKWRGRLVTVPSNSPENSYLVDGKGVTLAIGATMDFELIHDVITHCIAASEILGVDEEMRVRWRKLLERIPPLQIGKYGQLQEWLEDYDEAEPGHRHFSHLFGLFPGDQITLEKTPELAKAARTSLERRLSHDGAYTGWSRSWVVGFWARLLEGDKAEEQLRHLITDFATISLLDLHPPRIFQIDGNFGGTTGICELLMQSHNGVIRLLPALPAAWPEGEISGLVARGGVEISLRWRDGKAVGATLRSRQGGRYRVRIPAGVSLTKISGASIKPSPNSQREFELQCPKGKPVVLYFSPVG